MDALSPNSAVQRVVFMKAAQVGATEAGNNWIGFAIHQVRGPMLAVQPTVELAKRNSRQRIDPLIEESAAQRERVKPARSRDAGNTMLSKEFAGGILIMTGANYGGRAAIDPGAVYFSRLGRCLSGLGRRGRRSGQPWLTPPEGQCRERWARSWGWPSPLQKKRAGGGYIGSASRVNGSAGSFGWHFGH